MSDERRNVNLEAYLRQRVAIRNLDGGRGYDRGVRTFNCPLCGDTHGRGWMNIQYWTIGCFNTGCVAEPKLDGGALEFVRRLERYDSRADTWLALRRQYGTSSPIVFAPEPRRGADFCRIPKGTVPFASSSSPWQRTFALFAAKQWGLTLEDCMAWQLGYNVAIMRIVIPITINGQVVAYQARSVNGADPKYRTSRHGRQDDPEAECARPAAELLFNFDGVPPGSDVVLVEGPGDVMGYHHTEKTKMPTAVGLLGVALTPDKLAMILSRRPRMVIVALDAEPEAQARAQQHLDDLKSWDIPACLGAWRGAKDAGAGATLEVLPAAQSIAEVVRRRLRL